MKSAPGILSIVMATFIVALIVGIFIYSTDRSTTPAAAAIPPTTPQIQNPWAPGKWEAKAAAYLASHPPAPTPTNTRQVKFAARPHDQPSAPRPSK
jgi:hypothetical protein